MNPKRLFLALLPLTLAFRFWLAWAMPITGDEAYFVDWGHHPDWGFYDHPPMVGWWLAAQLLLGDGLVWLRLSAILQPALFAALLAWKLPRPVTGCSQERAWRAALLVLLAPVNVWNIFITTDTPLIYFSVLAALAWLRATTDDSPESRRWYWVAGAMLAGAVLSKYFAALLGFAFLVHVLILRRRQAFIGLAIAYACTLPALALMAWWNASHCWTNVMFNFINRHEGAGLNATTLPLYIATLLYVVTPPALWLWWKTRRSEGAWILAAVPFALFAVMALAKTIGLHWLLGFVPLVLLWLALHLPETTLPRLGRFFIGFAALHVVAIVVIALVPMAAWKESHLYDGIVLTFDTDEVISHVTPYRGAYAFASDGYSNAATLSYHSPQRFMVFGAGSYHARQDDLITDFVALNGGDILILRKSRPTPADYAPYFREVEFKDFAVRGVTFTIVLGRGFNYATYRDNVLEPVRKRYYAIPAWLPQSGCVFCQRYSPDPTCKR